MNRKICLAQDYDYSEVDRALEDLKEIEKPVVVFRRHNINISDANCGYHENLMEPEEINLLMNRHNRDIDELYIPPTRTMSLSLRHLIDKFSNKYSSYSF